MPTKTAAATTPRLSPASLPASTTRVCLAGSAPGPTRLSVPIEWERLQAIREQVAAGANGSGGASAPPSPELPGATVRRSLSNGDPGAIPFGGSIPEGGPFTPTAVPASSLPSPFANSLQAVSAGGMLSLGAMQQQQAVAAAAAAAGLAYPAGLYPNHAPRHSDNSSLTGSTAEATSSMHSTTSEGQQHAAAMAGGHGEGAVLGAVHACWWWLGLIGGCSCCSRGVCLHILPADCPSPSPAYLCLISHQSHCRFPAKQARCWRGWRSGRSSRTKSCWGRASASAGALPASPQAGSALAEASCAGMRAPPAVLTTQPPRCRAHLEQHCCSSPPLFAPVLAKCTAASGGRLTWQ